MELPASYNGNQVRCGNCGGSFTAPETAGPCLKSKPRKWMGMSKAEWITLASAIFVIGVAALLLLHTSADKKKRAREAEFAAEHALIAAQQPERWNEIRQKVKALRHAKTQEDEKLLAEEASGHAAVLVGRWKLSTSPIIRAIALFKTGEAHTIVFTFTDRTRDTRDAEEVELAGAIKPDKDGKWVTEENLRSGVLRKMFPGGRRFTWESPSGDFIVINRAGQLHLMDPGGVLNIGDGLDEW